MARRTDIHASLWVIGLVEKWSRSVLGRSQKHKPGAADEVFGRYNGRSQTRIEVEAVALQQPGEPAGDVADDLLEFATGFKRLAPPPRHSSTLPSS